VAKKKTRRPTTEGALSITSMMDMMTIILCFLLKSYQTTDVTIEASADLKIPSSTALTPIKKSVQLVVTRSQIIVDGSAVVDLEKRPGDQGEVSHVPDSAKKGQLIDDLYTKLLEEADKAKDMGSELEGFEDAQFKGQIMLQCDRTLPFSLIREVMYTAGQAQFGEFRFVVIKSSG
jgi:biopolymer transport protein ExbD